MTTNTEVPAEQAGDDYPLGPIPEWARYCWVTVIAPAGQTKVSAAQGHFSSSP
jgi:hypothetical protein